MVLKLIRYKAVSPRHKVGREFSQQGVFNETHVEAPKGLSNTLTRKSQSQLSLGGELIGETGQGVQVQNRGNGAEENQMGKTLWGQERAVGCKAMK